MTTLTKPISLSVKTKQNYYVCKETLMKKKINVLSSGNIKSQLNKNTYINVDIPSTPLIFNEKTNINEYIITFSDYDSLSFIKDYMKHPYKISSVKIADISYYLHKLKMNLMILEELDHDVNCSGCNFNALVIQNEKMNNTYVPISSIEFRFNKDLN